MSSEVKSIHEFDINIICEYYSNFQRQGPGSKEVTLKALSFINNLNENSKIVDLGCGTGGQTMILGQNTAGQIIGVDLFPTFINIFNKNVQQFNLQHKVKGEIGSMDNLSFKDEELDLIWSEGAIYNIGFERGLKEWRKFLKKGGYIAVSEASWFTEKRPPEIEKFWNDAYPAIDTIPTKVLQMQKAGYVPVAAFILPENCWTENFFEPQIEIQKEYLETHKDNTPIIEFIKNQQYESVLYNKYKQYYGYVFYVGKKL
ncbi:MAG: SAM-dependent methyltransferase [Marinilabiliales bacterium]|nr:MAG: SAM-dependent methyltransferase [Marinilabiliales bacterium]